MERQTPKSAHNLEPAEGKPCLTIVRDPKPSESSDPRVRAKANRFVMFMQAYADQVDTDIKVILDL